MGAQREEQAGDVGAQQHDRHADRHLLEVGGNCSDLSVGLGRLPPITSSKIAGMISATQASSSISDCVFAAVRSNVWRSRLRPPTSIAAPITSRTLPRIEPISDALTTSCRPSRSAKKAMISSGALPNVTLRKPPMPGPERARQLLGRAAHQRGRRDHAERGRAEDDRGARVRELEHDRDRDERDQQVRPPAPESRNRRRLKRSAGWVTAPSLRRRRAQARCKRPTVRAARRTSAPSPCPSRPSVTQSEYFLRSSAEAPPEPPEPEEPEPERRPRRRGPRPPSWPSSSSNGLVSEGASIVWSSLRSSSERSNVRVPDGGAACRCRRLDAHVDDHPAQDRVVLAGVDLDRQVLDRRPRPPASARP